MTNLSEKFPRSAHTQEAISLDIKNLTLMLIKYVEVNADVVSNMDWLTGLVNFHNHQNPIERINFIDRNESSDPNTKSSATHSPEQDHETEKKEKSSHPC